MIKINVATTRVGTAIRYADKQFMTHKKVLTTDVLPDFIDNYLFLQSQCNNALNIPRREMPVIEPEDMAEFERKIKKGYIDIFKPNVNVKLFPENLKGKKGDKWLKLGLKDGSITDDMIKAKIKSIKAENLLPLQSEIWLNKLIKYTIQYGVPKPNSRVTKTTIIVSKDYYILDGHHRWGQVMLADPTIKMNVLYIPLSVGLLLKITKSYGMAIGNTPNY